MINPDRPQADERGLEPMELRPAASPVDTYFRTAAGQQLGQIANALSDLNPELRQFADVTARRNNARDEAAGQAQARKIQAMQDDAADYRDAVQKGLIPPGSSPWFVRGAQEQFGRVAADQYASALQINNATALQYSTEPGDFEKEQQRFRQEWTQKHGLDQAAPATQQAFNLKADAHTEEARRTYAAEASDRLLHQADQGVYQEVQGTFDTEWNRLGADGKPMDDATRQANIIHSIQLVADRAYAVGLTGRRVNMAVATAIADFAKRIKDESVLDYIGQIKGGSGSILGTQVVNQIFTAARDEIAESHIRDNRILSEQNSAHRAEQLDAEETVAQHLIGGLLDAQEKGMNPAEVDLSPYRQEMMRANPLKIGVVDQIAHQIITAQHKDDPTLVGTLETRINTLPRNDPQAVTQETLVNAWASGSLTPATYEKLSRMIQEREKSGGEGKLLRDPVYTREVSSLRTLYKLQNGETPDAVTGFRLKAATEEFTQSWLTYLNGQGAQADDATRAQKAKELSNEAFLHHATAQQLRDLGKVPAAEKATGPQDVDWHTALVTDRSNVSKLLREIQAADSTGHLSLSQGSTHVLRDIAKLPLTNDPAENLKLIREFAKSQKSLLDRR